MIWSMPRRVLQVVASLIVLAAISSFTLGILSAPQRGRLPGERPAAGAAATGESAAPVTEATPLSQERIEGPPPPPPEEETADEDENAAAPPEDQAEEPQAGNAATGQTGNVIALAPPPTAGSFGNVILPPEEPPH